MIELYSSEYNKQINLFREGVRLIRKRNARFFDTIIAGKSIYDLADINAYFDVRPSMGKVELQFRSNSGLPDNVRKDISEHFYSIWPGVILTD
jgi:hypothetical protein